MKKILLGLFLAGATLVTTTSCTKEYITNQNFLPGESFVTTINSGDWKHEGNGIYSIKKVHYSVNYTIGSVMIFAEDRNPNPKRPEKMIAKVTLTDATGR